MFSWCTGSTSMRTGTFRALEDFCALVDFGHREIRNDLGANREGGSTYVLGGDQRETFQKLTTILLLTYALRNADCHSKNLALLYTSRTDARLAPAYDFFTTSVTRVPEQSPGISFMGRKTWLPGKTLGAFILPPLAFLNASRRKSWRRISDAVADTAPAVREV